jgi:hypothetical protein
MGIEIIQLVAGIDFAIERNPLNPIHNKLNELASHMKNIIHLIVDRKTKSCIVVDAVSAFFINWGIHKRGRMHI